MVTSGVIAVVVGYFLGSVPSAYIAARLKRAFFFDNSLRRRRDREKDR